MDIMEVFSRMSTFEKGYDLFIVISAILIFLGLSKVYKELKQTVEKAEAAKRKKTKEEAMVDKNGNLTVVSSTKLDKEQHESIRNDFEKQSVEYTMFVGFISILPLLGLLGTVWGLIPGLSAAQDGNMEKLYSSLSTALTSTFTGLIGTILLKFYVSVWPEKLINRIDMLFEQIDRRTDNAIEMKRIDES